MRYRSEIDGLRSLAIIPVVLFHSGVTIFSGGFSGVDIFFVISGYLISYAIITELAENKFSILEFYKRRILRILPAMIVMSIFVAIVAYFTMLPYEFKEVMDSIVASSLFYANIFFWRQSGYFDGDSELKPMLHMWSLSVEEQFYVFFPIFLLVISLLFKRRYGIWIALLCLLSFVLSVAGLLVDYRSAPSATFYLLPTRVWELGLGALIAAGFYPTLQGRMQRNIASGVGVLLIMWGVFMLSGDVPFPGWNALYPCFGAALIIAYARDTSIGFVLSTRPLLFFGKISYSLYLWHAPIIVFYRLIIGETDNFYAISIVITLSILVSMVSYKYIETPFRQAKFRRMPAGKLLPMGVGALLFLTAGGLLLSAHRPTFITYPERVMEIASYTTYTKSADYKLQFRNDSCFINGYQEKTDGFDQDKCLNISNKKKNYLLIGDSHGAHIWYALSEQFKNINILQATVAGCRPLVDPTGQVECVRLIKSLYDKFIPDHKLDGIIIAGRWRKSEISDVLKTVKYLEKFTSNVIVLGPINEYGSSLPRILAKSEYYNNHDIANKSLTRGIDDISADLGAKLSGSGAVYIPIYNLICSEKCIEYADNGVPLQFDYGHLTLDGARVVARKIAEIWQPSPK